MNKKKIIAWVIFGVTNCIDYESYGDKNETLSD